jgi:hypothetical protein
MCAMLKRKLHVRLITAQRSPLQILLVSLPLLVMLMSMALAIFRFERDGLRDQIDGEISFNHIACFTAFTIITVGITTARALIVSLGRDDPAVLAVLTAVISARAFVLSVQ